MSSRVVNKYTAHKLLGADTTVHIYGLYDPANGDLFYIGKTRHEIRQRLNGHIAKARKNNTCKTSNKIREILRAGKKPVVVLLFDSNVANWQRDERAAIAYAKNRGVTLTNNDRGGGGGH